MAAVEAAVCSQEEIDLLERSTKKPKTTENVENTDVMMESLSVDVQGESIVVPKTRPSFKDTLMGGTAVAGSQDVMDDLSFIFDNEEEFCEEDDEEECLMIRLTKEEKDRMRRPWRQMLIVKFLVKFTSKEDYDHAKFEGPWMVLDHYLIEWYPNFDPVIDKTKKMLVWVRFPCLPMEYYNVKFLRKVGKKIGRPIKTDQATSLITRGNFARLCVEVDITKPLLSKFKLRRRVRRIEYEGIHLVCFKFGIYDHRQDKCPLSKELHQTVEVEGNRVVNEHVQDAVVGGGDHSVKAMDTKLEVLDNYGPWMLVSRDVRLVTKSALGGRGQRDNVQITEKEIINATYNVVLARPE
ncbi:hypothetical protein PTKIN_Ptkin02bG0144100 [Pterospermum kingtungense]